MRFITLIYINPFVFSPQLRDVSNFTVRTDFGFFCHDMVRFDDVCILLKNHKAFLLILPHIYGISSCLSGVNHAKHKV